jgi:mRNA interferase MazF
LIRQGDVYWVDLGEPAGAGSGCRRPLVVIQNNVFNRSRIATVVVCALTSNLKRATAPGNVLPRKGEANLPQPSVANVSQVVTVDKSRLAQKIGALSPGRIREILDGIRLLLEPRGIE